MFLLYGNIQKDVNRLRNGHITQLLTNIDIDEIAKMGEKDVKFTAELYTERNSKIPNLKKILIIISVKIEIWKSRKWFNGRSCV